MLYAEIIIGPPGSGKSTYTQYKKELLKDRSSFTINLDPGNNRTDFDYDIKSICSTSKYMKENKVGPNYSVKCILAEFLTKYDDLQKIIKKSEVGYFLFDFPGQVEFLVADTVLRDLCYKLQADGVSLVCVNLVDSYFFIDHKNLLSVYLTSTVAMCMLEMPHICVMSKADNLKKYDKIERLEEVLRGMAFTIDEMCDKLKGIEKSVVEVVENESLLDFHILDYDNEDTVGYLQMVIDKASGFLYNENVEYKEVGRYQILKQYE